MLNQTGQPLEVIYVTMASYALIGLVIGTAYQPAQPPRSAGGTLGWQSSPRFLKSYDRDAVQCRAVGSDRAAAHLAAAELINWALHQTRCGAAIRSRACEGHDAACWVFIRLRFDQILYGACRASERWRVDVVAALAVLAIGVGVDADAARGGAQGDRTRRALHFACLGRAPAGRADLRA